MNSNTANSSSYLICPVRFAVALMLCAMLFSCGTSKKVSVPSASVNKQITVTKNIGRKTPAGKQYDVNRAYADRLIAEARKWTGTPYLFGGTTREGTDCSGFMMTLFNETLGVAIPRNSRKQGEYCMSVERNRLQPGDLVFFTGRSTGEEIGHVGMYIGDNKIIHSSSSRGVIESSLDEKYYVDHLHSYGRVEAITYAVTNNKFPGKIPPRNNIPAPAKVPEQDIIIAQIPDLSSPDVVPPVVESVTQPQAETVTELVTQVSPAVSEVTAPEMSPSKPAALVSEVFAAPAKNNTIAESVAETEKTEVKTAETHIASATEIDNAVRDAFSF
ncbi:MAG: C40 family peptidase [Muribaculaceae bacterium]|nr:C40 family peptidase [Muribaculaceae bacterium]